MKKYYLAITLFSFLTLAAGSALGQGQGNGNTQNNNASLGTPALLARIEALEAIVATLADGETESSDVAGSVYRTHFLGTQMIAIQANASQHNVNSIIRTLVFNDNGTGTWTILSCGTGGLWLAPQSPAPVTFLSPGCNPGAAIEFTYTQIGNEVEVTPIGALSPVVVWSVSNDASTIVAARINEFAPAEGNIQSIAASLVVGVRVTE